MGRASRLRREKRLAGITKDPNCHEFKNMTPDRSFGFGNRAARRKTKHRHTGKRAQPRKAAKA